MLFLSFIFAMTFLTPIGWIGLICLGVAVSMIVDAKNEARARLVSELKVKVQYSDTYEELKEFIDGL